MAAPNNKKKDFNQKYRFLGDHLVKPVLYNGRNIGHGKYFAGEVNGQLVMDGNRPAEYTSIGELRLR